MTPLGNELDRVWSRMLDGESGVSEISLFDASALPVRIAAEVDDWTMPGVDDVQDWDAFPRQTQFAVAAALDAAQHAQLDRYEPARTGVYLGCGEVFPDFEPFVQQLNHAVHDGTLELSEFQRQVDQAAHPLTDWALEPGAAVTHIARLFNAQGPSENYTTACVSASVAIAEATAAIREGRAEVMFAGGAHSMIHPLGITGFCRLSTLSTQNDTPQSAYKPFDRNRDGFVVGEGGAVLVLESLEHAQRRNANILAEITGYGFSHDAFRITDPRPDGRETTRAIKLALESAKLDPADVQYVNAHGSGTAYNDRAETLAIRGALGPHADQVAVSSTKSMTGHLTTACGALETLVCMMAVHHQSVPPTINYVTPDPQCDLDYVPTTGRDVRVDHAVNVNLGFGGHNVALAVSRFP